MSNLNLTTKRRYGLDFPQSVNDIQIDLILGKQWMREPYCHGNLLDPGEHMLRAARELFTPDQLTISPWTEEHFHAWASEGFSVWLGAASTGKSNDAGCLAVMDWVTDPTETYIALASTSIPMLKMRSFESVVRYFNHLKANRNFLIPGKYSPSQTAIINADENEETLKTTIKASIRGVALQDGGSESKAVAKLAGAHLPYVTIILDEGSALPPAAAKARINASAGAGGRFRFLSLANPVNFADEATKFCEPLDGGWPTVNERTPRWRSRYGLVLHHNGYDSPAFSDEGAKMYPFLINKEQIDRIVREEGHGNDDAPVVWTMVHGFPSPVGLENNVISNADILTFHMNDEPVWAESLAHERVEVAGLDPAFTSGGDNCVLRRATVGYLQGGIYAIYFYPPDYIPIKASSGQPAVYQIVTGLSEIANKYGIPIANVAVDDSGTQSVCDVIEYELGVAPLRCNFASKPSDRHSPTGQHYSELYKNKVTEIWSLVAQLGRNDQVRGLGNEAGKQFCARLFKKGVKPLALESKADYKKRLSGQLSPDEADATALAVLAGQERAGLIPGSGRDAGLTTPQIVLPTLSNPFKKIKTFYSNGLDTGALKAYRRA